MKPLHQFLPNMAKKSQLSFKTVSTPLLIKDGHYHYKIGMRSI